MRRSTIGQGYSYAGGTVPLTLTLLRHDFHGQSLVASGVKEIQDYLVEDSWSLFHG